MTDILNLTLGAVMGIACMIIFASIHHKPEFKGDAGFAFFWGLWWWIILVVFALFHFTEPRDWLVQSVDMVGNASLFLAAYALHKGKDFDYRSVDVVRIMVAAVILIVLCVVGGLLGPDGAADWHVFAMAPSQFLATTAFILLGIAGGERFPGFRVPIYVLCGLYGILQVPAYHAVFIEKYEGAHNPATADFWKWCLAAGKVAFAILAVGVLGFLKTRYMRWASAFLAFLTSLLSLGIAFFRFMGALPQ